MTPSHLHNHPVTHCMIRDMEAQRGLGDWLRVPQLYRKKRNGNQVPLTQHRVSIPLRYSESLMYQGTEQDRCRSSPLLTALAQAPLGTTQLLVNNQASRVQGHLTRSEGSPMTVPLQQTGMESQGCGRWPTVPKAAGARGNIPCPARGSSPHHRATWSPAEDRPSQKSAPLSGGWRGAALPSPLTMR